MNDVLRSYCSCRKCKTLGLNQRIGIIHDYESSRSKKPSIKSLALKFNCCYSEVKKILLNRDAILFAYKSLGKRNTTVRNELPCSMSPERQEKMDFFGKVMYEYIQRVLYCNYAIRQENVLQKALEFKHHLCMTFFDPNEKWLHSFKKAYGIIEFDLKSLRRCVQLNETKRPQLSASDIVEYVKRQERLEGISQCNDSSSSYGETRQGEHILPDNEFYDDDHENEDEPRIDFRAKQSTNYNQSRQQEEVSNCPLEPTIVYEYDNDGGTQEHNNSYFTNHQNDQFNHANHNSHSDSNKRSSNRASIETIEEALEHLKLLEEFAMLKDNFRAIGLLTQLEQCFTKQSRQAE